ncbi:E3 ubiquitin-protein ligase RBBP6-like isoform X3 [Hyperolius riggenbachi]|uniref:E3 ubiquitin-protein ligase RBBP6-like isoform X3 n=1 Tax=Hyperolius riggenbachi TaxID=752182 RepID=UPI0035A31DAD
MSCVHFKFFSRLSGDKAIFNGLCISLADLKKKIMAQMRLKAEHCELQITDALTQQEYTDEATLIPKNSSVIVRRIPIGGLKNTTKTFFLHRNEQESGTLKAIGRSQNQVGHSFHNYSAQGASKPIKPTDDTSLISLIQLAEQTANLADANAPEEDKIKAMMLQSACVHNPDKNIKTLLESARLNDSCFGCFLPGHYVKDCPTKEEKSLKSANKIKKSTGIPCSFMIEVTDPNTKGAMLTNSGKYAVPIISAKAYAKGKRENPPFLPGDQSPSPEEKEPIPDMLLCMICKNIMTDAAVIPCCGNSYCDECIRNSLLESEEHACPTCHKTGVSPDNIISNKGLREFINNSRRVCTKEVSKQRQLQATDPPSAVPVPSHNKENLMPALFKKLTNSSYGRRYSAPVTSANNLLLPDSLLMRSQGFRAPLLPLMHPLPDDWLPPVSFTRTGVPRPRASRPHKGWDRSESPYCGSSYIKNAGTYTKFKTSEPRYCSRAFRRSHSRSLSRSPSFQRKPYRRRHACRSRSRSHRCSRSRSKSPSCKYQTRSRSPSHRYSDYRHTHDHCLSTSD